MKSRETLTERNEVISAVIPVRKGSQRVKDKNLRPFANTTLLENKIDVLLKVPEIDHIIINTDSERAIELVSSKYSGSKVIAQRRDPYFASSKCSGSDFFTHLGEVTETDIFIYAPCTSPFVRAETVSACIKAFKEKSSEGECDCVSTVSEVKEFLWLDGKAINYDPSNAPNSQDLPGIVALNFGVTVISRKNLIDNRNIIGRRPYYIVTSEVEGVDIDTQLDFDFAEYLFQRNQMSHQINKDVHK